MEKFEAFSRLYDAAEEEVFEVRVGSCSNRRDGSDEKLNLWHALETLDHYESLGMNSSKTDVCAWITSSKRDLHLALDELNLGKYRTN